MIRQTLLRKTAALSMALSFVAVAGMTPVAFAQSSTTSPSNSGAGQRHDAGSGNGQSGSSGGAVTNDVQPGANSFTADQAMQRLADNGYTNVTGLKKNDQSQWEGTASKGGKPVKVTLDYRGNIKESQP